MTLDDPEYVSFTGFRLYMGVPNGASEALQLLVIRRKGLEEMTGEWQAWLEHRYNGQQQ